MGIMLHGGICFPVTPGVTVFTLLYIPVYRVPTAPGKPGKVVVTFPFMEISWNFKILKYIMEK